MAFLPNVDLNCRTRSVKLLKSSGAVLCTGSLSISLSILSENDEAVSLLPSRSSEARDVFDLSASANLIAPLEVSLLSVVSENETASVCYY